MRTGVAFERAVCAVRGDTLGTCPGQHVSDRFNDRRPGPGRREPSRTGRRTRVRRRPQRRPRSEPRRRRRRERSVSVRGAPRSEWKSPSRQSTAHVAGVGYLWASSQLSPAALLPAASGGLRRPICTTAGTSRCISVVCVRRRCWAHASLASAAGVSAGVRIMRSTRSAIAWIVSGWSFHAPRFTTATLGGDRRASDMSLGTSYWL